VGDSIDSLSNYCVMIVSTTSLLAGILLKVALFYFYSVFASYYLSYVYVLILSLDDSSDLLDF
jgi:hypothetical protein